MALCADRVSNPMRIRERQFGNARVVDCQGPLVGDDDSAELRRVLLAGENQPGLVVVNLTRVDEVDCDGLFALAEADRAIRRAGGALRVAMPADRRHKPQLSERIHAAFDAFDSVEDALADLRASMARRPLARLRSWWLRASSAIGRKGGRAGPF